MMGRNLNGSFVDDSPIQSVTATSGIDVKEPETVSHEDQVGNTAQVDCYGTGIKN
jgi:hypothetical protein